MGERGEQDGWLRVAGRGGGGEQAGCLLKYSGAEQEHGACRGQVAIPRDGGAQAP